MLSLHFVIASANPVTVTPWDAPADVFTPFGFGRGGTVGSYHSIAAMGPWFEPALLVEDATHTRSEERRVGKECLL